MLAFVLGGVTYVGKGLAYGSGLDGDRAASAHAGYDRPTDHLSQSGGMRSPR